MAQQNAKAADPLTDEQIAMNFVLKLDEYKDKKDIKILATRREGKDIHFVVSDAMHVNKFVAPSEG